jgi:hypothetical protein
MVLNMTNISWEAVIESPLLARSHFASTRWTNKIVLHGGCCTPGGGQPLDSVVLFDPRKGGGDVEVRLRPSVDHQRISN